MKYTKFIAAVAICVVVPSCSLAQSAMRLPSTLLDAVGRTTGMVNNVDEPKTEVEKQEEEAAKLY